MQHRRALPWLGLILAVSAAPSAAQVRERLPEPSVERAWVEDEEGLRQWAEYDETCPECRGARIRPCQGCAGRGLSACSECDGTEKAKCRSCAGTGKLPDPLVELPCIFCKGGGWYHCPLCNARGYYGIKDVKRKIKCGSCKTTGFHACAACEGTRRLPVVVVKRKGPGEAKLKDLLATRELLQPCLVEMDAFEPAERPGKSDKALSKILAKPARQLEALAGMQDMLETVVKGLTKAGANLQSYEANVTHQYLVFKDRTLFLLKHQVLLLDLCIERAEHNEQVEAGGK